MSDKQMMFILEKKFSGCWFQEIIFHESGNMEVKFFDSGGNFHHQTLKSETLATHD